MKVLIASSDMEASRQLNKTVGKIAPVATYLHADCAERVLSLFESHRIDLVLLDLQLVAKNSAASTLLRLLNPGALAFTPLREQLENMSRQTRPGVLLTFDGNEVKGGAESVVNRLQHVAPSSTTSTNGNSLHPGGHATIWAQSEEGDWKSLDARQIQWAVSEAGKVRLRHTCGNDYFVRDRLKELERQLGSSKFVRIHKSYLVNARHVSEVQRWSSGGLLVQIDDEQSTTLPVSRRYASRFRKKTGWRVGPVNSSDSAKQAVNA